jgi:hypothetical protein
MAQLSRTYQVVLIVVAVLALAWFTVLRDQVSNSPGGSSSPSSSQSARSSSQGASGPAKVASGSASTHVYKGPLPGLKGLSRDINRAHEAVATANAQSQRLESATGSAPSAKSTSSPSVAAPSVASSAASNTRSLSSHRSSATHGASSPAGGGGSPAASSDATSSDARAVTVEQQLKQGKVVLLLFWNSKSFDGQAVHSQVLAASHSLSRSVATDFAKPSEVGAFGTVTRDISVLQTPTLLVINQKGLATTITGLTDAFSIEQAVREAR